MNDVLIGDEGGAGDMRRRHAQVLAEAQRRRAMLRRLGSDGEELGGLRTKQRRPGWMASQRPLTTQHRSRPPRRCGRALAASSRSVDGRSNRSKPTTAPLTANSAPTWPSTGAQPATNESSDSACTLKIDSIAEVGDETFIRPDLRAMASHTSAWSDMRSPRATIENDTYAMRFARPVANCVLGADVNVRERDRQRPASTQDTGMVSSEFAATRIVRLTTRFCLAPRSSSPSTIRTGVKPRLMNLRSGTLPCSEISVISARPDASASSKTE